MSVKPGARFKQGEQGMSKQGESVMDAKSVWFVKGAEEEGCFTTKTGAEAFARMMFQDEDPSTRYARIYYRNLWKLEEAGP